MGVNAGFASHVEYAIAESRFTKIVVLHETHLRFRNYPYLEYHSVTRAQPRNLNTLEQKRNILPYTAPAPFTHAVHR